MERSDPMRQMKLKGQRKNYFELHKRFCSFVFKTKLKGEKKGKKNLKLLQPTLWSCHLRSQGNTSQTQSKWLGMLSDLHSTLWELKASFSENVKASSSCILFSPCSAGGSSLCSVEETDLRPSQLNPSFSPCQLQQTNKQTRPEVTREGLARWLRG